METRDSHVNESMSTNFGAGTVSKQIADMCDTLRALGEYRWARRLDDSYFCGIGMDALRTTLGLLSEMRWTEVVTERPELVDQVVRTQSVLEMAVGLVDPPSTPSVPTHVLHGLLDQLHR